MTILFLFFTIFCYFFHSIQCQDISYDAANTSIGRDSNTSFHFANFVKHKFKRLNVISFKVLQTKTEKLCHFYCLGDLKCVSYNVGVSPNSNAKYQCELLDTDMFSASQNVINNATFHHFGIMNGCVSNPCKNNGTCSPDYKTNTFTCKCKFAIFGSHCETACRSPLGMEDGRILDSQITASSVRESPSDARLNKYLGKGSWRGDENEGEYLQIDLGTTKTITMVATQGNAEKSHWVVKYELLYSENAQQWSQCYTSNLDLIFVGNSDSNTVVTHDLQTAYRARHTRFLVREFYDEVSMRVELYGCD